MAWSDFISGITDVGKSAGEIYQSWQGSNADSEETAYLQGQLAGLNQAQQREDSADIIKIGSMEISTNSVLWIIGGTLGLLAVGLGIKKML